MERGSYQFRKLSEAPGDLGDVPEHEEVLRLEDVDHAVAPDLTDNGLDAVPSRVLTKMQIVDYKHLFFLRYNFAYHYYFLQKKV